MGGPDFLAQVQQVARLHLNKVPATHRADIEPHRPDDPGCVDHLVIRYTHGPFPRQLLVGAYEGAATEDALERLLELPCCGAQRWAEEPQLVSRAGPVPAALAGTAAERGVWLRSFDEYEASLWEHGRYLAQQTRQVRGDPSYPLDLHIDKRWSALGAKEAEADLAAAAVLDLLDTDRARFVLVLGDAGTGKTFLMRMLAARLAERDGVVPVLLTMRGLEKAHSLRDLLSLHMSKSGEDPFHEEAFRHMLRVGRVVLLVDGFDELGLRASWERVPQHFAALREAADGAAKVVVTSRLEYFATDHEVRKALGDQVKALPGSRILRLFPLDPGQRRALVTKAFGEDEARADEFLTLLGDVPDLLGLASNPRMLTFMIDWLERGILTQEQLRAAARRAGGMTAGGLYQLLVDRWLDHQTERQSHRGGLPAMSRDQRLEAVIQIALVMWCSGEHTVTPGELGQIAAGLPDLAELEMRHGEAVQTVGSGTLLIRSGDGEFRFIHQSVMEWLVARHAAKRLAAAGLSGLEDALATYELTPLMARFLADLADEAPLVEWARRTVGVAAVPGGAAKPNAALVLNQAGAHVAAVDYTGQDLRGRDFTGRDLTGANLDGADLRGATLRETVLRDAGLRGATLRGARLDKADLRDADLTGTDLSQARLLGADLRGALLDGATLRRAALTAVKIEPTALDVTRDAFGAALPNLPVMPQVDSRSSVTAVAAMPRGDLLCTGHHDGSVRVWDAATGALVRRLEGHTGWVRAVAVAPDGAWVVSGGDDGTVRLWDAATGALVRTLEGHTGGVLAVAVAPDGAWVVSGGADGTVRLWDAATGALVRRLEGHTGGVLAVAVAPDGAWVVSGGADGTVRLWDLRDFTRAATLVALLGGWAVLLPDGSYKVGGETTGLWWASGLCRFEPGELDEYVPAIRRLPDDAPLLHG